MFAMMTVIVAPTDAEAKAKLADYRKYVDPEGALTLMSGWTGVDFFEFDPNQIVEHVEREAGRTAMENITRADPGRRWTVREVVEHVSIGGIGPVIAGSPSTVADQLEGWIDDTDLDGFNLTFVVRAEPPSIDGRNARNDDLSGLSAFGLGFALRMTQITEVEAVIAQRRPQGFV